MSGTKILLASLCCLAMIQSYFAAPADSDQAVRSYLEQLRRAGHDSHQIMRRLPPLVPPSFGDEDHFDERQVYGIPRVGRSFKNEDLYNLQGADVEGDFSEIGRDQVRQVFSKIPRVGRSARSVINA